MRIQTMMSSFACLMLIVLSTSGFADEQATKRITLSKVKMTLDIPANWRKGGISGKMILASFKKGKSFYPNLNISLIDNEGKSLRQVFDKLLKILPSAKVISLKEKNVDARKILISDTSWKSILGELRALRLMTKVGNQVLLITFVDSKSNFNKTEKKFYLKCFATLKSEKI